MQIVQKKTDVDNVDEFERASLKSTIVEEKVDEVELTIKALSLAPKSDVGVFLYKVKVDENGEIINQISVGEREIPSCKPLLRVAQGKVYLDIEFPDTNDIEIKSTKRLYERYLDENTKAFTNRETDIEFVLCITLTATNDEDGMIYSTEYVNPDFMSYEDNLLRFVVESDNVAVHRMTMDYDQFNAQQEVDAEMSQSYEESLWDKRESALREELEDELSDELYDESDEDEDYEDDGDNETY